MHYWSLVGSRISRTIVVLKAKVVLLELPLDNFPPSRQGPAAQVVHALVEGEDFNVFLNLTFVGGNAESQTEFSRLTRECRGGFSLICTTL